MVKCATNLGTASPNFRKFGETMRFLYEETAAGIRILRSFGGDPSVVLPEMVEGKPVTDSLITMLLFGSYRPKDLEKDRDLVLPEDGETGETAPMKTSLSPGEKVSEVFLPETLKKSGATPFTTAGN